jgi:hypothetical protein
MSESNGFSEFSESAGSPVQAPPKLGIWGVLIFLELAGLWVVIILFGIWMLQRLPSPSQRAKDTDVLKAAAKDLEARGLAAAAASAWQAYLDAQPEGADRLEVLMRIGQLYLRAEQYPQAAQAFALLRQEGPDEEVKKQAEAALAACERLSGLYSPIEQFLAQRRLTSSGKTPEGQVVAIVGDAKLTEADLDLLLRNRLDQLLAAQGLAGDAQRRDAELRQWNNPLMRARLLRALVQNDLFLRRAREMKLHEDPEFLAMREETLETLLLRRFVEREIAEAPPPTPADIEAYYRQHQAEFQQPEMLHVVLMHFPDAKSAAETASKIQSADQFVQIAANLKGANGQSAAGLRQVFRGRTDPLLGNTEPLFQLQEGQWTQTPLTVRENHFLVLVDKKVPARTAALGEVQRIIEQTLLERRRQEALDRLFEQLAQRYGVKILLQAPSAAAELPRETDQTLTEKGPAKAPPPTPKSGETPGGPPAP